MLLWDVLRDADTSLTLEKHGDFLQSHSHLTAVVQHGITLGSNCPLSVERYRSMEFGCEVVQLILTGFIVVRT